uniref:SusD/RagB family nutrient-binding outer membrane lipoprotein n=1 Tax=Ornithobacterium rhinotracheale TaxID=28251 RepID=UPI001C87716A|nr:SusD/RagB family nutrient-binding outer membrane lipoprotein [Ornithobacterium rhinotracheale]
MLTIYTVDDEAKMQNGAGLNFINNIETLANQYNECRMGASIFSYLVGYQDPRINKYFKNSESPYAVPVGNYGSFQAINTGNIREKNDLYKAFSIPNIEKNTPTYWLRTSEVLFLRAEGALLGWNMGGSPKQLYTQGIEMSFAENGVSPSLVNDYINSGRKPAKHAAYGQPAPSEVTTEFSGSFEEKLQKIITQKWLALYPNGQEAWSEWRRTGYPELYPVSVNKSGGEVDSQKGIRRMRYPISSRKSEKNIENINQAISLLGGEDKASTNLWWDKKN